MRWNSVFVSGSRFYCFARRELARAGLGLLLLAVASTLASASTPTPQVSAARVDETDAARGTPIAEVLNPDGTLNLPTGQSLTIDPTGYKMLSAPNAQPRFAPETLVNPGNENWASGFSTGSGFYDTQTMASVVADSSGNVYVGAGFFSAGSCSGCGRIAKWNGTVWSALDTGVTSNVTALALDGGGNLYAAGNFTSAGTCTSGCNQIAKWNGTTWSALGTGINGMFNAVNALAVDSGGNVYVGGDYPQISKPVFSPGNFFQIRGIKKTGLEISHVWEIKVITGFHFLEIDSKMTNLYDTRTPHQK